MSTYLDHPYQGTPYVSGVPVDLIIKVGMAKQARYDANAANLQDQLNRINDYNIVKESDKTLVGEKLKSTVDQINNLSGLDLSDSKVYNQLSGITSSLYNDPKVYTAIADNQRHHAAVKERDELIKKDPNLYSASNDYVFRKQEQAWLKDPNARFNASYVPAVDVSKWQKEIVEMSLKNPQIMREAEYMVDANGNTVKRGEREMKRVLAEKIQAQLNSSMDNKVRQQLMIDREYQNDNLDPVAVSEEINTHIGEFQGQLKFVTDELNKGTLSDSKKEGALKLQSQLKDIINRYHNVRDRISETGDVGLYYTPEKYINDYTSKLATAWENQQEGELKDDFIFTENFKHNNAKDLESFKSSLEIQTKIKLAEAGLDASGKPLKGAEELPPSQFEDNFSTLFANGKANFGSNELAAMFNTDSKVQEDGSFGIVLHSQPMFLDVQPTLEALGVSTDAAKSAGIVALSDEYAKFRKSGEVNARHPRDFNMSREDIFKFVAKKYGMTIDQAMEATSFKGPRETFDVNFIPSMDRFMNSPKGKELATKISSETGLDITNAADRAQVEKLAKDPGKLELLSAASTMFKSAKFGRVNVVPMDGDNVFSGSDGKMYTKVLGEVTQSQLVAAFGDGGYLGKENYKKLLDAGFINETGKKDKDGNTIYQIPIISQVKRDPTIANQEYLNSKYTNKEYATLIPGMAKRFNDTYNSLNQVQGLLKVPPDQLAMEARTNLGKLKISPELNRQTGERLDLLTNMLKANPKIQDKIKILQGIDYISKWDGTEAPSAANLKSDPSSVISAPGSKQSFEHSIKMIKRGISANETIGPEAYKAVNKQSGAMGKYQFLESTLKNSIYSKYYNKQYGTFSSFKNEFMDNATLQEEVMDKWLMDIGRESNWNPYRTALTHFVGGDRVTDLIAGQLAWDKNPTEGRNIDNSSPLNYLSIFASKYDN